MWGYHTNRERPSCVTCHRAFFNSTTLRNHIKRAHSTKERPRFPCSFPGCEKTFLNKIYISQHVKTEHAQTPILFACTLCGREFKLKNHLNNHFSTHTKEKSFKCATCGRSFALKMNLKNHEVR